jgi:hypothetical protein
MYFVINKIVFSILARNLVKKNIEHKWEMIEIQNC